MRRSTAGAAAAMALVFAAGVAAGVALDRTWLAPGEGDDPAATPAEHEEKRDGRHGDRERTVIERFSEELELTGRQRARIDTILAHFRDRMHEMWSEVRPRYRTLVDSARSRIIEVLDEEQARRYRELLERERERHDGYRDDDGRGGEREGSEGKPSDGDGAGGTR